VQPVLGWIAVPGCLAHESDGRTGGDGCDGGCDAVQQGSMWDITVWEMEMEDALRRISRMIQEEEEKGL